jgi:hypothetical protein
MPSVRSASVFRGYAQDRRPSMQIYSEHLVDGLRAKLPGAHIREIVPLAPHRAGNRQMLCACCLTSCIRGKCAQKAAVSITLRKRATRTSFVALTQVKQ